MTICRKRGFRLMFIAQKRGRDSSRTFAPIIPEGITTKTSFKCPLECSRTRLRRL